MRLMFKIAAVVLLLSAAYDVYLLGHKILFVQSPTEYETMYNAIQGAPIRNYPGFFAGLFGGFLSPLSDVVGFFAGYINGSNGIPDNASGLYIIMMYSVLFFVSFCYPEYHFGFLYDVGFLSGTLLIVRVLLWVLGIDFSKLWRGSKSETLHSSV